jgi:Tol biopolymer transport system component
MGWHPSATRDGKRLAFVKLRRQSDVYVGALHENGTRLDDVRRLTLDDRDDHPSCWSRDSRSIYFSSERQGTPDIFRQGIGDPVAEPVVQGPGAQLGAELSPDGQYLLYSAPTTESDTFIPRLMRAPLGGGPPEPILEGKAFAGYDCSRAPGGSCILVSHAGGTMSFHALDPLMGVGRLIGEARIPVAHSVWSISPDGTRIAYVANAAGDDAGDLKIMTMSIADGTSRELPIDALGVPIDLSWAADNKSLFAIDAFGNQFRLLRIDPQGRASVLRRSVSRFSSFNLSFQSPDGKWLAFDGWTPDANAWVLENF